MPSSDVRTAEQVFVFHRKKEVERAVRSFLEPRGTELSFFSDLSALFAEVAKKPPRVVVLDLFLPATSFTELKTLMLRPECAQVQTLFVAAKDDKPGYADRIATLPRARLVAGDMRLTPRIIEALAEATGIPYRRYFREGLELKVKVAPLQAGDAVPAETFGQVVDLSDSGLKVKLPFAPAVESEWTVSFPLPESESTIHTRASVVRTFRDDSAASWFVGMRFVDLTAEQALVIRRTTDLSAPPAAAPSPAKKVERAEPVELARGSPRIAIPPRLEVKARLSPRQSTARHYFDVEDVSAQGFRAVPRFVADLAVGTPFEVTLLWEGTSLSGLCTLARTAIELRGQTTRRVHGFQFLTLNKTARQQLSKLLHTARDRGVRKSPNSRRARPGRKSAKTVKR